MQLLVGRCGFEDANTPVPGKSDWGMDAISRKLTGHISLLSDFIATLEQGQVYLWNGTPFYLQTWNPDESAPIASVTLNYVGLIRGTPPPEIRNEVAIAAGNTSASFAAENNGLGRLYAKDLIWSFADTVPDNFSTTYKGYRDRYAVSATMEFTYRTVTTTYRYVSVGQPAGPSYTGVQAAFSPTIERVRIITSDGQIFGSAHIAVFGLTPVQLEQVISFQSQPVFGSPFYLCQDVVRRELVQSDVQA